MRTVTVYEITRKRQFYLCSPLKIANFGNSNVQSQQRFIATPYV